MSPLCYGHCRLALSPRDLHLGTRNQRACCRFTLSFPRRLFNGAPCLWSSSFPVVMGHLRAALPVTACSVHHPVAVPHLYSQAESSTRTLLQCIGFPDPCALYMVPNFVTSQCATTEPLHIRLAAFVDKKQS